MTERESTVQDIRFLLERHASPRLHMLALVVVAAIAVVAFSILVYVVYIAPALFAELLLDAGLAAGLYRRLASLERRSWLATALRRTAIPAASIAVLLGIGGQVMQAVYPEAVSIGRVVDHVRDSAARHLGDQ